MKSLSILTDLSNDLLLEIFDYLDVFDIFQSFSNLNERFNLLIVDRRINFQSSIVSLSEDQWSIYKSLILPQVGCYFRYLSISDRFGSIETLFKYCQLNCLQSVRLYKVKLNQLKAILVWSQLISIYVRTRFIQNEKHLDEIFHDILTKQAKLRSVECNFHRRVHFLNERNRFSRIRSFKIVYPCFSSDLIVLINQLPFLVDFSAMINDHRREEMDRDLNDSTENPSVRSLDLHIKHLKWDRLKLFLCLMTNLKTVRITGEIEFDLNWILDFGRRYKTFRCDLECSLSEL